PERAHGDRGRARRRGRLSPDVRERRAALRQGAGDRRAAPGGHRRELPALALADRVTVAAEGAALPQLGLSQQPARRLTAGTSTPAARSLSSASRLIASHSSRKKAS